MGCGGGSGLEISIRTSDSSFCPGGILRNSPEKPEAVQIQVALRKPLGPPVTLSDAPITLKLTNARDRLTVLSRRLVRVGGKVGESWTSFPDVARIPPPEVEGRYVLEASTADGVWATAEIEVWHDPIACPRPGAPVAAPSRPPPPVAEQAPSGKGSQLQLGLRAHYRCDDQKGVDDLRVEVLVGNPDDSKTSFRGVFPVAEGIDELEAFSQISGKLEQGYLRPGGTLIFEAHGWIETGPRPIEVKVPTAPGALLKGVLPIDCSLKDHGVSQLGAPFSS